MVRVVYILGVSSGTVRAGRDSLMIEVAYRLHHGLIIDITCPEMIVKQYRDEHVSVLGGLYKLNLIDEILEPIYVEGAPFVIEKLPKSKTTCHFSQM